MPAPKKWKKKVLLAKIETIYGTDAAPTPAANAIQGIDVQWTPMEGSDVSRDLERPFLGADATIPTELHAKLAFKVEISPSGEAGTAPAWGPLLRGCAVAEVIDTGVSVTYSPVTDDHESLTMHLGIDGTRYVMTGARGTAKLNFPAQGVPQIEFEFTGLFSVPTEAAIAAPTLTAFTKPQLVSSANTPTFTLDGTAFVMRSCGMMLGNAVETRFLVGSESVVITDKAEAVETTVEAQPLTAFNPFSLAAAQAEIELVLVHGTGAGKITTLEIPKMQLQRPQGLSNAQNIKEWPLRGVPLDAAGNDQWTLALT